jgi:hypothetical protein
MIRGPNIHFTVNGDQATCYGFAHNRNRVNDVGICYISYEGPFHGFIQFEIRTCALDQIIYNLFRMGERKVFLDP